MECGNDNCGNDLPSGAGTETFMLEEEAAFTPRPHYCSEACCVYVRQRFYGVNTGKVNGKYPWEASV